MVKPGKSQNHVAAEVCAPSKDGLPATYDDPAYQVPSISRILASPFEFNRIIIRTHNIADKLFTEGRREHRRPMILTSRCRSPLLHINLPFQKSLQLKREEGSSDIDANSPMVVNTAMLPIKENR